MSIRKIDKLEGWADRTIEWLIRHPYTARIIFFGFLVLIVLGLALVVM